MCVALSRSQCRDNGFVIGGLSATDIWKRLPRLIVRLLCSVLSWISELLQQVARIRRELQRTQSFPESFAVRALEIRVFRWPDGGFAQVVFARLKILARHDFDDLFA